jgi:hypothetical protein
MYVFGVTVLAKDSIGPHYANQVVYASDIVMAEHVIIEHYKQSDEVLIEIDQVVELEDVKADGTPRVLDTIAKNYFETSA